MYDLLQDDLFNSVSDIFLQVSSHIKNSDSDASGNRMVHVFRGQLLRPLEQLKLLEGQDWTLASLSEMRSESIWSERCREYRPMAAGLTGVVQRLHAEGHQDG